MIIEEYKDNDGSSEDNAIITNNEDTHSNPDLRINEDALSDTISFLSALKLIGPASSSTFILRVIWSVTGFLISAMIASSASDFDEQENIVSAGAFIGTFQRLSFAIIAIWLTFYGNQIGSLYKELLPTDIDNNLNNEEERQDSSEIRLKITRSFQQSMLMSLFLGIPTGIFLFFSGNILVGIGEPKESSDFTQDYFRSLAWGLLPMCFTYNQEYFSIGMKKPLQPFGSGVLYTISYLGFSYFFVKNKDYKYLGLGWAASISYGISFISQLIYHQKTVGDLNLYKFSMNLFPTRKELKIFFSEGGRHALQIGSDLLSIFLTVILIGLKDKDKLDTTQVVFQYYYLLLVPLANAANSVSYVISQEKNHPAKAKKIRDVATVVSFSLPLVNLAISLIFPKELFHFFMDEEKISQAGRSADYVLWVSNATLCFYLSRISIGAFIRGFSGETADALKASLISNVLTLGSGSLILFFTPLKYQGFFYTRLLAEMVFTPWLFYRSSIVANISAMKISLLNEEKQSHRSNINSVTNNDDVHESKKIDVFYKGKKGYNPLHFKDSTAHTDPINIPTTNQKNLVSENQNIPSDMVISLKSL